MAFDVGSIVARLALNKAQWDASISAVKADQKKLESLTKNVNKKFKEMGDNLAKAGKKLTTFITIPLIAAGGAAIKMAMDAVESENLFEVSMGKMAGSARKWSKKLRDELGLNSYEVRKNVGTFNVMLKSMNMSEDAAYDMAKGLTQLAYDMASFYNLRPDEAFNKLKSGIVGMPRPLQDLGIVVHENTIKTWALTHGIIRQGQELTNEQKILARYNVIMEQTKASQGDLARTLDSPANKLRIFKSRVTETAIAFGMKLLPFFERGLAYAEKLVKWFSNLSDGTRNLLINFGFAAAAIGPMLLGLGKLLSILPAIRTALATTAGHIGLMVAAAALLAATLNTLIDNYKDKQDAEMKAMIENATPIREAWELRKRFISGEIGSLEEWKEIFNKHGKNYARVMRAISTLPEYAHIREEWEKIKNKQKIASGDIKNIQKEMSEELKKLVRDMTDVIMKESLNEFEYRKWAAHETYKERKAELEKEGASKKEFVLLEKSLNAELKQIEKDRTQYLKEQNKERGKAIMAGLLKWREEEKKFQDFISEQTDMAMNLRLTRIGREKDYKLWALDESYRKELQVLKDTYGKTQKYYDAKVALDMAYAEKKKSILAELSDFEQSIYSALTGMVASMVEETLSAFERWGEGTGNILQNISEAFKNMADFAIDCLKRLVAESFILAAQEILAEKAKAIASMIAKIIKSIPFPFNLMAVGGAVTAVKALFSSLVPKFDVGGVAMSPMLAEVGHGRGELILPLEKAPQLISQITRESRTTSEINLHFHGPLISTTGLSDRDIDRATEYFFSKMNREAKRYGYKLKG